MTRACAARDRGRSRWAAAVALGLLAATAGVAMSSCKRRGSPASGAPADVPPRLGQVLVADLTPPGALPEVARIDANALAAEVRARLRSSQLFGADAADSGAQDIPTARVRIEIGMEDIRAGDKAAARGAVRFRVDTRPAGVTAPHWNEDVQAGAEATYALTPEPDLKAVFGKLASRAIGDITSGYLARQRVWRAGPAEVRAVLGADAGAELHIEAIRAIAERKLTSEVPSLLRLLSADDEALRDAALGALVELGERRAVTEIAKQRSMRDRREMRKILDAIATLGGEEASDYLSFVAESHEDEEIRGMAKGALDRLKRRSGPPR